MAEYITVDELVHWAENEKIDLGLNPRRMLIYLASKGIIPKTTRGHNCKGVYRRDEVLPKLAFYDSRRREGWRIRDIQVAIAGLDSAQLEIKPSLPLLDIWKFKEEMKLFSLPISDTFKSIFLEFLSKSPVSAASIVQYLDEQEILTGIKVGQAFRNLIGWDTAETSDKWQMHIQFQEKSILGNRS